MKSKRALITLRLFAGLLFFSDASLPHARGLVRLELQGDRLVRRAFQNAGTATNLLPAISGASPDCSSVRRGA